MTTLLADQLDGEWVELVMEAKRMGLNIEEIRRFFQSTPNIAEASAIEEEQPI